MWWVILVLLASMLWAFTNFIDKYLIEKYFSKKIGILVIFSGIIGFFVAPIFLFLNPNVLSLDLFSIIIIILNSFLLIFYLFPYFRALEKNDASTVVPLFQLIPLISIFLGYLFFGEVLTIIQIFAGIIMIISSVGISLDFSKKLILGFDTFVLMFLSSFLVALNSVIFKFFSIDAGFFAVAFWQYIGFSIIALIFLVFVKKYRLDFIWVIKKSGKRIVSINAINEVINIFAQIIFYSTFVLAPIGLIWLFNGFQPFFVLIIGLLLTILFPKIIKENVLKKVLYKKLFFIILLFIGGILLYSF